jgi:hypothetical protein
MSDDELRKLLQNSLAGRRAPTQVRERILQALRPRKRLGLLAAAALLLAAAGVGSYVVSQRPAKANPTIVRAIEQHLQSPVFGHASSTATPREVAQTVSEVSGRDIHIPGLRDGGFTQMQAHCCEATGWAHVIYANSWLKVSCFILDSAQLDVKGGTRLPEPGIEAYSFSQGSISAVAVRESGLAKIWVGDLRPENLAAIALDAEQKRHQLQTMVLSVTAPGIAKQLAAMLMSTPGIEDFQVEPAKQEATVRFDRRRVTVDELAALLVTSGLAASPRDWGGR